MNNLLIRLNGLRRILAAALVSILLWSMAVAAPAYAADVDDYTENDRGTLQTTERYEQIQPKVGGMNNFEDIDPRTNTKEGAAQAKKLQDVAERRYAEAKDPLEPARKTIRNAKDHIADTIDETADKISR
jgi:hypothetical protein